ncbi:60S ribosomal protein L5 [Spraguea lophii 42_110]|uniref:60S ribosomal protein L5 n=1 Tax=Spraguea lophii (strain 42_110) TaxID=1358809 RepID=S7XIG7_SPRLO|nr:Chain LD0, 60S ribosomal protein L5 [Spraguea lophii 42_110]7QJH_KD0 Chain KD0, 60S ribosomal protein L5 [Spraguea lophii 42_110]7QJH_LD0 Chain LD0, 60S ribosomal protein L5 [Spraguea lophii 42_110]8BR3_LD0 Chain LD0, 60S ribosomal protein L5 [Spraguea lophii 42_110]8P5D_LD0 Chain LD0, 60S ribosomal protein L5 [Spraguea lophii 42_110]8P60_KD0 Chain KD0, 60S ribosomal protein L5 [Spraguea lophii 42_110]8P60_LD0 Chain LD0, 60S ribosomal protein L5 [Spraguea lophii 42_110]EPR78824.1 60S ribo
MVSNSINFQSDNKSKKSYFQRFQTKKRRRRLCKTNYRRRTKLIKLDQKNVGEDKSRLVVRITNSKVICQVVKSHLGGDMVVAQATSAELKEFGLKVGFTNYSAAYATGLLCARKILRMEKLDNIYKPKFCTDVDVVEDIEGEKNAYRCYLDIGLSRNSKGAKVFAAMKGASDGGIKIPYSPKIFPGYNKDEEFDQQKLRDRIFGKEVANYMQLLKKEDETKFKKQFSEYIKQNINAEDLEKMYENLFNSIVTKEISKKEKKDYSALKKYKVMKLTKEERDARVQQKLVENN